jgi:hypothetical protein
VIVSLGHTQANRARTSLVAGRLAFAGSAFGRSAWFSLPFRSLMSSVNGSCAAKARAAASSDKVMAKRRSATVIHMRDSFPVRHPWQLQRASLMSNAGRLRTRRRPRTSRAVGSVPTGPAAPGSAMRDVPARRDPGRMRPLRLLMLMLFLTSRMVQAACGACEREQRRNRRRATWVPVSLGLGRFAPSASHPCGHHRSRSGRRPSRSREDPMA